MLIWIRNRLASFDQTTLLLSFILTFIAAAMMGVQSDTWWQLRTGQIIFSTGQIPITDSYSSTVTGSYWPNHEWLAELLFFLAYDTFGLYGLFSFAAIIIMSSWIGLAALAEGPGRVRAVIMLIGMTSQAVIWSVRPHLFSMALIVPLLLLLSRPRWHWLYPLIFLLWANLHAGVAFGGVVLLIATGIALLDDMQRYRRQRHSFRWRRSQSLHWALITALSGLATLLNPLGIGLWSYILHAFNEPVRNYLSEWQAPRLDNPRAYPFFTLLILVGIAVFVSRRSWCGQRDWTILILAALFAYLGLRSIRHTAFLPIIAVPILSRPFQDWKPLPVQMQRWIVHSILMLALVLGGTALVLTKWASIPPQPLDSQLISALQRCPGTLYNTYDTGGPLIWQLPERPVFIDNRQDPYPGDFLFEAVLVEQTGKYQQLFAKYEVQCALIPTNTAIYLTLNSAGWQELGRADPLIVLMRPASP